MALRGKIVNFLRRDLLQKPVQVAGIREVAVVQEQALTMDLRVIEEMLNALRVEVRGPANHAVDDIAFVEELLRKVGAVLAGDAGDESGFHGG